MKLSQLSPRRAFEHRLRGFSLVELMVAVAVGFVMLGVVCTVFATSNKSFADMGNYVAMDHAGKIALEKMTREIRNSENLVSFATNRIEFVYAGTTNLIYTYDSKKRELSRSVTGEPSSVILGDVDSLEFSMYKNSPLPNGAMGKTTSIALGKCIQVTWKCSRSVLGQRQDSQNVEQAIIVIRNKPVL